MDDRRAKVVSLSDEGWRLLNRVLKHHPVQIQGIMAGLNKAQQRELRRLLELLAANLELTADHDGPAPLDNPDHPGGKRNGKARAGSCP